MNNKEWHEESRKEFAGGFSEKILHHTRLDEHGASEAEINERGTLLISKGGEPGDPGRHRNLQLARMAARLSQSPAVPSHS